VVDIDAKNIERLNVVIDPSDHARVLKEFAIGCKKLARTVNELAGSPFFVAVFVISPFVNLASNAALRRCVAPLLPAVIQIVSAADVISAYNSQTAMREVALAVYNKCRVCICCCYFE